MKHFLTFGISIIIFCTGTVCATSNYSKEMIKQLVVAEANKQKLDPALALAVAKVESDFDENAVSHAGAIGVMQIMPKTARTEFHLTEYQLYDPKINIRTGISYLKQLINIYQRRTDIALSHYNGGSAVNHQGRLRVIPVTQQYVDRVLTTQDYYSRRYADLYSDNDYVNYSGRANNRTLEQAKSITLLDDPRYENTRLRDLYRLRLHNLNRGMKKIQKSRTQNIHYDYSSKYGNKTKKLNKSQMLTKVKQWESIYN